MKKQLFAFILMSSMLSAQQEFTDLKIKNYSPTLILERNTDTGGFTQGIQSRMLDGTNNWFSGNVGTQSWVVFKGNYIGQSMFTIKEDGNIGVGTINPQAKLDIVFGGEPKTIKFLESLNASNSMNSMLRFTWYNDTADLGIVRSGSYPIEAMAIRFNQNEVARFTPNGNASLQGKFEAKEIKVTLTPTADFVFDEDYDLPKLEAVEKHIKEKKYLPEIASAKEMEKEGVNVGEFQIKLLQKIEELTLYTIELNKQVKKQAEEIEALKKSNNNY
ncbi:hypothetical protein KB553_19240 [Chryseobacterium rhizoplanae]|uniref:hypothetical protein n=1 Tax=Chryseobacterium rhizoplanae TaxID=1609531 RepID=UPI001CE35197|nr:hypothetical protein [Chryseobacterium rhizoplanae]UCA59147.1 hypothetical protein KB553_19240 [Chryseobacterium rhizoplanae]